MLCNEKAVRRCYSFQWVSILIISCCGFEDDIGYRWPCIVHISFCVILILLVKEVGVLVCFACVYTLMWCMWLCRCVLNVYEFALVQMGIRWLHTVISTKWFPDDALYGPCGFSGYCVALDGNVCCIFWMFEMDDSRGEILHLQGYAWMWFVNVSCLCSWHGTGTDSKYIYAQTINHLQPAEVSF